MTTSRNSKSSFSNSYSTLTSQVPFPAGDGQHVTNIYTFLDLL